MIQINLRQSIIKKCVVKTKQKSFELILQLINKVQLKQL